MKKDEFERKNVRAKANYLISFRYHGISEKYDCTQTQDVSAGGMCITTDKDLPVGAELDIIIRIPFLQGKKIEVVGRVIESLPLQDRAVLNNVRIKFSEYNSEQFRELDQLIKRREDAET
ncbi:MAG: PilZ domain-containing protein [Candidatus Omnitrophota bacterium]